MIKKIIITFILIFMPVFSFSMEENYRNNAVVVKFNNHSTLLKQWKNYEKIDEFSYLIGQHVIKSYVSENSLNYLKTTDKNERILSSSESVYQNLSRISIIEYNAQIDPLVVSSKLSTHPEIEYAEPLYINEFFDVPNDPDIFIQYYLGFIKSFEAMEHIPDSAEVLVGIIDTGIDYTHEDLAENIYVNPGENGIDNNGNSRRDNGIDDDDNGYIDDWHGWDFVSSDSLSPYDNDPFPGHEHGTHVGGTISAVTNNNIGIAGASPFVKLLPVKVGRDNPLSRSVVSGYDGILYAAIMGCDVINCSWGSGSHSSAGEDIIYAATELGSVVVAAAGNDGEEKHSFPAAYDQVMSVAAIDENDKIVYFSNYATSVDVSAPGVNIYATIPGNEYKMMDGTSMATPIAASVCAFAQARFPEYTPIQIIEHVKATSINIDSTNTFYKGYIGKGKVNALNTITQENVKSIIVADHEIFDESSDGIIERGEQFSLNIALKNILSPADAANIKVWTDSPFVGVIGADSLFFGEIETLIVKEIEDKMIFSTSESIPENYIFNCFIDIYEHDTLLNTAAIEIIINPSYRTLITERSKATFNSVGNIGFNDYPTNSQGVGYLLDDYSNILFEGSLMIGIDTNSISNVARSENQDIKETSFRNDEIIKIIDNNNQEIRAEAVYDDFHADSSLGISILQNIYHFNQNFLESTYFTVYDIVNHSGRDYNYLYAGLYFDWDIGPSGMNNQAYIDTLKNIAITENVILDDTPFSGVKMISSQNLNYYAIDNDGTSEDNPGVWDGFSRKEKFQMLSNGISRVESNITDASYVIGAGPIILKDGDTVRVSFIISADTSLKKLADNFYAAETLAEIMNLEDGDFVELPPKDRIANVYPNPISAGELNIEILLKDDTNITIEMYDLSGRLVLRPIDSILYLKGKRLITFKLPNLAQGYYFLTMKTNNNNSHEIIDIIK